MAKTATASEADERLVEDSGLFDGAWYVDRYKLKLDEDGSALRHFLAEGGRSGLSASARFISSAYFALYPDVARSGANPLLHYLKAGKDAGKRAIRRDDLEELGLADLGRREQRLLTVVARSGGFDERYYLEANPEARTSGLHPMLHYVRRGLETLANPGPDFDAAAYVVKHPDAIDSGLPPLVHYERSRHGGADADAEAVDHEAPLQQRALAEEADTTVADGADVSSTPEDAGDAPPALAEALAVALASPLQPEVDAPTPGVDEPVDDPVVEAGVLVAIDAAVAAAAASSVAPVVAQAGTEEELRVQAALAALSGTRLFDAAWYTKRYVEVARSGLSPALHYLQVGGPRRRRPGPLFDAEYYVGAGPVLPAGANPVLHYLTEGRRAGRPPTPLLDVSPPPGRVPPESEAGTAPERLARDPEIAWTIAGDAAGLPGAVLFAGEPLAPVAPQASLGPLEAFARLSDLDPAEAVAAPGRASGDGGAATFGDGFVAGPKRLVDLWLVDARTLRLRFGGFAGGDAGAAPRLVARGYQIAFHGDGLRLCGEALLPATGPGFVDLALLEPLEPVLLALSEPGGRIVDFALLPFPSLVRGGVHYAELVATAPGGDPVEGLRLLGEKLLGEMAGGPGAIARLLIDPAGATGAEPIFGDAVLDWLARRFGVTIGLDGDAAASDPIRDHLRRALADAGESASSREGLSLRLPPDALPSLTALTARRIATPAGARQATGAFVVAAVPSGDPRLLVTPPALDESFFAAPARGVALDYPVLSGATDEGAPPLLAIRRRRFVKTHDAEALRPVAPDVERAIAVSSATLAAIVFCEGTAEGVRLIESISRQAGVSVARVSVRLVGEAVDPEEIERAAARVFGDRADVAPSSGDFWSDVAAAAQDSGAAFLLVAKSGAVAADPATLSVLMALAEADGVASAACLTIHEDPTKRAGAIEALCGGYFATPPRTAGDDALNLIACQSLLAFPSAAYPVAANALDFAVLRADAATPPDGAADASPEDREVAWALRELLAGRRHVCTSAVRVVRFGEAAARQAVRAPVSAEDRAVVEANATVVREFAS